MIRLILGLVTLMLASGCTDRKTAKPQPQVLARVDGTDITLDAYKDDEFYLYYFSNLNITIPDERLEALVDSEVLTQEAERLKIQDRPKARLQIQQIIINELLRDELEHFK